MAGPIRISVLADGSQAQREFVSTANSAETMGSKIGRAAKSTAVTLGRIGLVGAAGLAVLGKASVDSASNAQQSLGATETVYKRFSDTVIKRSNLAANAIGLSANEYRELSNVVGASLSGAGVPLKETTRLTGALNKRAADMAATFGGTTREAIESISSALRGETDPIERYGVSLKASDVTARLAAQGLDKLTGEGKKQAEMQARLDLLFQKTKTSQGAFGRESNTLAGQQQRLSASVENLKAKVGTALIPVLTQGAQVLNSKVVPALSRAADKYLPRLTSAIGDLFSESPNEKLDQVGDALDGIDWGKTVDGAKAVGSSLLTISGAVGAVGLDALNSGISVTSTVLGFAADNSDKLAAALPFLAAGFVAVKVAQAAANIALALSLPLRLAEVASARQQTVATRALTAAVAQLNTAQGAGSGATVTRTTTTVANTTATIANTTAINGQVVATTRLTAATTVRTTSTTTSTAATAANTSAQTANNAAAATGATTAGRLGAAVKGAAGIGGMLALTSGLSQASAEGNSFSSVMKGAAGGAGIGAMFGPIGALVGAGVGGGLSALVGAFAGTSEEARQTQAELARTKGFAEAEAGASSLRDALVGVIRAYGETSRAAVEASFAGEDGKLSTDIARLRELGVSMDTIVSATLGQADAQAIVTSKLGGNVDKLRANVDEARLAYEALADGITTTYNAAGTPMNVAVSNDQVKAAEDRLRAAEAALEGAGDEAEIFSARISKTGAAINDQRQKIQGLADDLGITVKQYRAFPKAVRTDIEANGLRQTADGALRLLEEYKGLRNFRSIRAVISAPGVTLTGKQIGNLARQYKLTPRQVRTLFRVEGVEAGLKGSQRIIAGIKAVDRAEPKMTGTKRGVERGTREAAEVAGRGGKRIRDAVEKPVAQTKADLGSLRGSLPPELAAVQGTARSGGVQIGAALKSGIVAGFAGTASILASQAGAAVRAAIAAGRAAGRIKSPSRETYEIGSMLGKGMTDGLDDWNAKAGKSGRDLVRAALAGIDSGSSGIDKALGRLTALVEKRISLKSDKKERARERAVLKGLRDEYAQLRKNGQAQDRNTEKLKTARDRYKSLVDAAKAYATSIKDGFVSYGSVVGLGTIGGGDAITSDRILSQLTARLTAARRFAALIKQLSGSLNSTSLQQLIDAGVEGGLGTAEAILAGGASAVTQINTLTAAIATAGGGLGDQMSDKFKAAGIQAAAGLVLGLEKEQARLDRAAERIGGSIVRAIQKALGIKSPSRVFRKVGEDTMAGLAIGLDQTHAQRLGAGVARGVTQGYARPALETSLPMGGGGSATGSAAPVVNIYVTVGPGASPVEAGRQIVKVVDAYFQAGGRTVARWGG